MNQADSEASGNAAQEIAPGLVRLTAKIVADDFTARVFFEPAVLADSDQQVMAEPARRRRNQRAHVILGAAAVSVKQVQDSVRGPILDALLRSGQLAQRAQGIGSDIAVDEVGVVRMALEEQRRVAQGKIGALGAE